MSKLYKEGASLKEAFNAFEKEILYIKESLSIEGIDTSIYDIYNKIDLLNSKLDSISDNISDILKVIDRQSKFIEQQKLINKELFRNE